MANIPAAMACPVHANSAMIGRAIRCHAREVDPLRCALGWLGVGCLSLVVGCSAGLGSAMREVDLASREVGRASAGEGGDGVRLYQSLAEQELQRARECTERGDGAGATYWARRARVDAQLARESAREASVRGRLDRAQREAHRLTKQLSTISVDRRGDER